MRFSMQRLSRGITLFLDVDGTLLEFSDIQDPIVPASQLLDLLEVSSVDTGDWRLF
jgi:trehalose-6-phosphatase